MSRRAGGGRQLSLTDSASVTILEQLEHSSSRLKGGVSRLESLGPSMQNQAKSSDFMDGSWIKVDKRCEVFLQANRCLHCFCCPWQ